MAKTNCRHAYYIHVSKKFFDMVYDMCATEEWGKRLSITYRGTNEGGELRISAAMADGDLVDAIVDHFRDYGYEPYENIGYVKHLGNGSPYRCRRGLV